MMLIGIPRVAGGSWKKSLLWERYRYFHEIHNEEKNNNSSNFQHFSINVFAFPVNRSFHGRGGHLGSGANAAKFTVNVWGKS